jgi:hypothetical protein
MRVFELPTGHPTPLWGFNYYGLYLIVKTNMYTETTFDNRYGGTWPPAERPNKRRGPGSSKSQGEGSKGPQNTGLRIELGGVRVEYS